MLLRLLPAALLACSLLVVGPADAGTCIGVSSGDDCLGAYAGCPSPRDCLFVADPYLCVGSYDGDCTGVQKP